MSHFSEDQLILITGASGFIGSHLTQRLLASSPPVRIRLLARPSSNLTAFEGRGNVHIVRANRWDDADLLREAFRGVDYAFNTAGAVVDWAKWEDFEDANITMVRRLVEAAVVERQLPDSALKRFVHISTADVYGYPANGPSEDVPPRDIGIPYITTKIAGEAVVMAAKEQLPVTVFRPASVYGPGSKDFVLEIATLLRSRLMLLVSRDVGAGLIHVDDLVDGLIKAATSPNAVGQIYNMCGEEHVTWRSYVNRLADELGYSRPFLSLPFGLLFSLGSLLESLYRFFGWYGSRPLLTRHAVYVMGRDQHVPIDKAKRELEFQPRISLDAGVDQCVAWLKTLRQFRSS
ncbi:MAG: NAD-dependent epimerase/dehydratase family protein [Candidatus Binatia bacterium]